VRLLSTRLRDVTRRISMLLPPDRLRLFAELKRYCPVCGRLPTSPGCDCKSDIEGVAASLRERLGRAEALIVDVAIPLEVIFSQHQYHPYRELSSDLTDEISKVVWKLRGWVKDRLGSKQIDAAMSSSKEPAR
jgi:hypothetical protein